YISLQAMYSSPLSIIAETYMCQKVLAYFTNLAPAAHPLFMVHFKHLYQLQLRATLPETSMKPLIPLRTTTLKKLLLTGKIPFMQVPAHLGIQMARSYPQH